MGRRQAEVMETLAGSLLIRPWPIQPRAIWTMQDSSSDDENRPVNHRLKVDVHYNWYCNDALCHYRDRVCAKDVGWHELCILVRVLSQFTICAVEVVSWKQWTATCQVCCCFTHFVFISLCLLFSAFLLPTVNCLFWPHTSVHAVLMAIFQVNPM